MASLITYDVHPDNPQERLLKKIIDCFGQGGVVILPTDCSYVIAAHPSAARKLREMRGLSSSQPLSLFFHSVDALGDYVKMDNSQYRYLKKLWPGPYTVILKATHSVPKKAIGEKRKTIGVRVPNHQITQSILRLLDHPLVVTSLIPKGSEEALVALEDIHFHYKYLADIFVPGALGNDHSTVMDWSDTEDPIIIRQGKGVLY